MIVIIAFRSKFKQMKKSRSVRIFKAAPGLNLTLSSNQQGRSGERVKDSRDTVS